MTALRRFSLAILALLILLTTIVWWLLSTESGARFLLARASGFFPDALSITEISGTVRTRLVAHGIQWKDETADAQIERVEVGIDLRRLWEDEIALDVLNVDSVKIKVRSSTEETEPSAPLDISLPVRINLQQSTIRDIQLDINGAERRIDLVETSAAMNGADLRVRSVNIESSWLNLSGDASIRLSGTLPLTANVDWEYFDLPEWPLAGRLEIGGDFDSFAVEHVLRLPVEIQTSGDLSLKDNRLVADLENRWDTLSLQQFGLESRRGVLNVSGSPDSFALSVSAVASITGVPETTLNAEAQMTTVRAESLYIEAGNAWGQTELRGEVSWREAIQFALDFGLEEVDVQAFTPALSGQLAAQGRASGSLSDAGRNIDVEVETLDGTLNGYPVDGSAVFALNDDLLKFERFIATIGTNRINASGSIGDTVDAVASLNADTLDALHPDLQGAAEASLTLRGAAGNPMIDLRVVTNNLWWQDTAVDELSFTMTGSADRHSIDLSTRAFTSDLALQLDGSLLDTGWEGDIGTLSVTHPRGGEWLLESSAPVELINSMFALRDFCLLRANDQGRLCANVRSGKSTDFSVSVERIPVSLLPLPMSESIRPEGDIVATIEGKFEAGLLDANALLEVRDAQVASSFEDETRVTKFPTIRLDAEIEKNRLTARSRIETQEGSLQLESSVDNIFEPASKIAGTASLELPDLGQLSGLLPALANPAGTADGELQLSGSLNKPEITGAIELRDGAFGIRPAGVRVQELEARISQDQPGALAITASAQSGGGRVELLGETSISDDKRLTTTLTLTGDRFELLRTPDIQALASPDVTVVISEAETTVRGELSIPEASVKIRDIPPSAARVSPDAVVHRQGSTTLESVQQRPINIDLKAEFGEKVRLSAFGLNTNLRGSLQLRGDANKVINGYGRVSLVEGRYKAYGQDLSIQRGELIFNGPLGRPQLDVRAVRNAGAVVAGIQVRGTPDALQSEVFSEPALRDIEALSYLLTGRPLNQDNRDGDLLGDAAFALGLSGAGSIASRVRSNLGLDTLTIQGGSENGRIVAGKRLNDRLLVEYGYGIVDKLGTLLLRYQLNERLVLESRTGLVSNLDLVYRVRKP